MAFCVGKIPLAVNQDHTRHIVSDPGLQPVSKLEDISPLYHQSRFITYSSRDEGVCGEALPPPVVP